MSDPAKDDPRPFSVKTVEYLLNLMSVHNLSEIDLTEGDQRIRFRKESSIVAVPAAQPVLAPAQITQSPAQSPSSSPVVSSKFVEVKSELPGTFYTRPAPDKPEFVKVGSKVAPETTVCLVVAMKVNNEIKAGVSGIVREIVARNEEFVDYGAVLFRVEPA